MADMGGGGPAKNVVTSGPPYPTILKLAIPTVLAMVSQALVNTLDTVFVGKLENKVAAANGQAALLPSLVILWAFGGSLSAISVGTQALTARRFAEKKDADVGEVLFNSVAFSLIAGIVFTALGFAILDPLLNAIISGDNVEGARSSAREYMHFRLFGIASMSLTASFKAFFDGIGKTYVHFVSAVFMNIVNVSACYCFIFGKFGAPEMGMAGAGLGAIMSTWVGLLIMVAFAMLKSHRTVYRPFRLSNWNWPLLKQILKLSIPGGVATIAVMTGFVLFAKIAAKLDDSAEAAMVMDPHLGQLIPVSMAATNNIVSVVHLTFTACLGFGTAAATLVSQCLGERNPDRANKFGWSSVQLGLMVFGAIGALEFILAPQILRLVTDVELVQHAALTPMRMMAAVTPLIATAMILTQALFGAGNTRFVMVIELILHFGCLVPLAWVLGVTFKLGLTGLWSAAITYIVLLAIAMAVKFRAGGWKNIKI
ncbi:MAG: MATE family efflux transporter [Polyangiaceae bacterium]